MLSITKKLLPEERYNSSQDINMRLKGTIIRYDGIPVLCHGAQWEDLTIYCIDLLDSNKEFRCHSSDAKLDISSAPIGWMNFDGRPMYISRSPRWSQRQGIDTRSLNVYIPGNDGRPAKSLYWDKPLQLRPVAQCILNDFPAFKTVLHSFGGAFDRDWAVANVNPNRGSNHYILYHKMVPVGSFFTKSNTFFFRKGRLTKTRRLSLEAILFLPKNSGVNYAISEQH